MDDRKYFPFSNADWPTTINAIVMYILSISTTLGLVYYTILQMAISIKFSIWKIKKLQSEHGTLSFKKIVNLMFNFMLFRDMYILIFC